MIRITIVSIILFFMFSACEKDQIITDPDISIEQRLPKIELRSIDNTNNKTGRPLTPSLELQNDIYTLLTEWDKWASFNNKLVVNQCRLRWNWATIDHMEEQEYTVVIPVTNDQNAIILYIMYSTVDDHAHFHIMTVSELKEVTSNFTSISIDDKYLPFIIKTAIYDYYIYHRTDGRLSNWFKFYFSVNEDKIQLRTSFGYYWVDSYVINGLWDSYVSSSRVFFKIPCPYDGQGVSGGGAVTDEDDGWKDGWFTGVGGSSDNDNDTNYDNTFIEEHKDCLEEHAGIDLISLVLSNIDFPCDENSEEIINSTLESLCNKNEGNPSFSGLEGENSPGFSFGVDEFYNESGLDDIIIEESSFTNCRKVKCVYDLLDNQNNGLFCETFGELFDSDHFSLSLSVVPRNKIDGYADGSTGFSGSDITIKIAEDFCDGDDHPLTIAGTLLHEAIHASMYQQALESNPSLNSTDYCLIWQEYFQTSDPCHEVMANHYVNHLASSIRDLDGNRFSLDHYLYIAWGGLESVGNSLGLITDEYASEYYDEYQNLINSPFNDCN